MKFRNGFVTNSSSSSFIISKSNVTYEQLNEVIKEIILKDTEQYGDKEWIEEVKNDIANWENIKGEYIGEDTKYEIITCKLNESEDSCYYWGGDDYDKYVSDENGEYYKVDNNCCSRYNWDIVESVLNKHNIKFEHGYCD